MRRDDRFADMDRAALHNARLEMRQCPHCARDLQPVAFFPPETMGCGHCKETWYLPDPPREVTDAKEQARDRASFALKVAKAWKKAY